MLLAVSYPGLPRIKYRNDKDPFFSPDVLDLLKSPYLIASIFDMYIDVGDRKYGKQDGPVIIIEGPPYIYSKSYMVS